MNCINYRTRTKKGIKYGFCKKNHKEVPLFCKNCNLVDYKQQKPLKNRTNKQNKKEKERFSIIYQDLTKCCVCSSKIGIEKNEIFEGSYRSLSIKYGMVCPFCKKHHDLFHNNSIFNLQYKVMFQKKFMENHSLEEFIAIFKQNYIYKLDKSLHKKY